MEITNNLEKSYLTNNSRNNILLNNNYNIKSKNEKINALSLETNRISGKLNKKKETNFMNVGNNSSSFLESINNKNIKNNNKRKLTQKILLKQKILKKDNIHKNKNIFDINGLTNEIMNPSFLRNNTSITLNSNN